MLCANCKKNEATTYIKQTINGVTNEYHLCSECAQKLGMAGFDPFDVSDLWSSLFEDRMPAVAHLLTCDSCKSTFDQIAKRGKLGCPECYTTFREQLMPSIRQMHGKTRHVGKVPGSVPQEVKTESEIDKLKRLLNEAVTREDYEKAAEYRDQIKALEKKQED